MEHFTSQVPEVQVFVSEIWYSQYWKGTEGSTEFRVVPKGSGGCGF